MMTGWMGMLALAIAPQAVEAPARPEVAVVVLTLDDVRQGQVKHGRGVLETLGHDRFGRYRWVEPTVPVEDFRSCEEDHPDYGLNFCARFYLHQGWTEGSPPTVVVAFTDRNGRRPGTGHPDEMRVLCYGRGGAAHDPGAQDTWLWPSSARLRGMRDLERDWDAVAACIDAALSEQPGVPRPDRIPD